MPSPDRSPSARPGADADDLRDALDAASSVLDIRPDGFGGFALVLGGAHYDDVLDVGPTPYALRQWTNAVLGWCYAEAARCGLRVEAETLLSGNRNRVILSKPFVVHGERRGWDHVASVMSTDALPVVFLNALRLAAPALAAAVAGGG